MSGTRVVPAAVDRVNLRSGPRALEPAHFVDPGLPGTSIWDGVQVGRRRTGRMSGRPSSSAAASARTTMTIRSVVLVASVSILKKTQQAGRRIGRRRCRGSRSPVGERSWTGCWRSCSGGPVVRCAFLNPRGSEFYRDWDRTANDMVAVLPTESGGNRYDKGLTDLVGELRHAARTSGSGGPRTTCGSTTPA